jgi:hypothetical protein
MADQFARAYTIGINTNKNKHPDHIFRLLDEGLLAAWS